MGRRRGHSKRRQGDNDLVGTMFVIGWLSDAGKRREKEREGGRGRRRLSNAGKRREEVV